MPGVCERLEPYLASQMVGQELALQQLADAVCDHVGSANPAKPLVLSAHGPPGVGKSLAHLLMARALYNPDAGAHTQCPGMDCPGYKVRSWARKLLQHSASWHRVRPACDAPSSCSCMTTMQMPVLCLRAATYCCLAYL